MITNTRNSFYERFVFIGEGSDMNSAPIKVLLEVDLDYFTEDQLEELLDGLILKLSKQVAKTLNEKANKGTVN